MKKENNIDNNNLDLVDNNSEEIINAIKTVFDPEIPIDIYSLGLIYDISIDSKKNVHVLMTLTSPNCPAAESIPAEVEKVIKELKWTNNVTIEITFDPPYDIDMMSEEAKLELDID